MTPRTHLALVPALALFATIALTPRAEALPEAVTIVAKSLATHYGVSDQSVTALLEKGMSMETVTQLLLVKESSGQSLEKVTDLYGETGNSIQKTADQLNVAASAYSKENVQAAMDKAKADASAAASNRAAEETTKAVDSVLGGFGRE